MKKYGKTKDDVDIEKSVQCRDIVKEIISFGVDENQKLQIIKLMALELESNIHLKKIVNMINEISENGIDKQENGLIGL
tara:strand:+ start:3771 stop:4007 length:237 start_codon:yes stop_codon:yes gene_type:complete